MESIELQVDPRDTRGKGASRKLRRAGRLAAVLYGPKLGSIPVSVDAKDLEAKAGSVRGSVLVRLQSAAAEIGERLALVKELQRNPVTGELLHADFYEVDVKSKLRVRVPIEFVGKPIGVEMGGILQPVLRELEVLCLPTDIPKVVQVNVSSLAIHDVFHLSDVQPPPGVEVHFDSDEPVVTILAPTVEEVKVEAAEGEEAPAPEEAAPAAAEAGSQEKE